MGKLFLLITFCIFQLCSLCLNIPILHAYHLCPLHQRLSLLNFKHSLQIDTEKPDCSEFEYINPYDCDANNNPIIESKISSWNSSSDCCSWEGVICDEFTGEVIELDLSASRLIGVIHSNSTIFQLSHLRRLNLAYNLLGGSKISPQFRRLTHLSHLNLTECFFEGEIPSEISQLNELVSLDLSNNDLFLEPHVFKVLLQNMTGLRELSLSFVNISSSLPKNLSSSLTIIDLSDTYLKGTFPYHIFHLPNVQQISLSANSFDDFVSSESVKWNNSSSLQKLELAGVVFPGKLLDTIGNLNQLSYLDLSFCELSGTLPQSFGNLTQISHLDLSWNGFSGHIPLEILGLEHLTFLDLQRNQLNTSIPHFASNNMKMLKALKLSYNKLTSSSVSSILSNLTQLEIIELTDNPLYKMPPELFELSSLQSIDLVGTQLYGPIPKSFSNLVNLKYLDLRSNNLSGPIIQKRIFSNLVNLEYLNLALNKFSGPIIQKRIFSNLVNLKYLNLASNNLSGPIETKTFSNLVNLKFLNLAFNKFSGPIIQKRIFSNHVNLEYITLASNNFTGPIEIDALYNLVNLMSLNLSSNNFGTTLDVKFLSRLKGMEILDLSFSSLALINEDNITLPMISIHSLRLGSCNISDLDFLRSIVVWREVYLPNNKIHGQLPQWVWSKWSSVMYLDLSNNFLTHIGNKISLQWLERLELRSNLLNGQLPILPHTIMSLDLSNNQFHGEIKPSICKLGLYVLLDLSNNNLNGALPHCIGMMGFKILDLSNNSLNGALPHRIGMVGLRSMNLGGNHFEGEVPRSLINCSNLEFLDLSDNHLNDTFPIWLGNLPNLRVLSLRSNKLYGPISFPPHASIDAFSHLQILDLSYNQLSGSLPYSLFHRLRQMMNVDETYNNNIGDGYISYVDWNFSYFYPNYYHDSMTMVLNGNLMQLERIQSSRTGIDLSCNHLEGEIPSSIGGLISIQQLNLSHNNFTGQIPPQIENLSNLQSLDLSCNQLGGNIPDKFAALEFLSVMNLSYNNLSGPIPSGRHFQTIPNASYMGNDDLCGFPLTKSCGNHESPQHSLPDEEDDREFFDGFTWQSVVVGYCVGICIGLVIGSLMLFIIEKPKWLIRIAQEEAYRMILKYKARNGIRLT